MHSYRITFEFCTMNTRLDSMKQFDCKEMRRTKERQEKKHIMLRFHFYISQTIYAVNALLRLLAVHDRFKRRTYKICVCVFFSFLNKKNVS